MIGYTTIGVKDIEASKKFYTELFDAEVLVDAGRLAMIGTDIAQPKVLYVSHLTVMHQAVVTAL